MNLIDEFAMAAMQGFVASGLQDRESIAKKSYAQAEAMMVERSKRRFNTTPPTVETPPLKKISP